MYTIPEDCPSRIVHDPSYYHASDNLFNKAKSLTDSEEILITHEFSFEDIPEGIPLEDPLYDNLTKRNKYEDTKQCNNKVVHKNNNEDKDIDNKKLDGSVKDRNETPKENEIIKDENEIPIQNYIISSNNNLITESENTKIKENSKDEIPKVNEYLTNINRNDNASEHPVVEFTINESFKGSNITSVKVNNEVTKQRDTLISKENNTTIDIHAHSKITNEVNRNAEIKDYNKNELEGNSRVENNEEKLAFVNPSLTDFHVIDSEKDLDFPTGIEGPIPAIVMPPKSFVAPTDIGRFIP